MARPPQSSLDTFNSDWSKAVGWAQSQGIGASSYLPVYQMDVQRIQNGEYPMGAAERNLAIAAAHNPNNVSSVPTDNPNPSNVLGNTVSDAGKIATGLIGIFTGSFEKQVWHSAQTTFEGIMDPARLQGGNLGTTIGNWLTKSLLSYVPGAYDIGTVLEADPTLSGSKGIEALLQHPLVSALDLFGADAAGAGIIGKLGSEEGIAGAIGARTGMAVGGATAYREAVRSSGSIFQQLADLKGSSAIGKATLGKIGVGQAGNVASGNRLVDQMSISDVLGNMAAKVPGVGPAIGDAMQAYSQSSRMAASNAAWIMEPARKAMDALDEHQQAQLSTILDSRDRTEGNSVVEAMEDPNVDPLVKQALTSVLEGPLRYSTEDSIFSGGLRPTPALGTGQVGLWVGKGAAFLKINAARVARDAVHRVAAKEVLELAPFADKLEKLDALLPKAVQKWDQGVSGARKAVAEDMNLQGMAPRDRAEVTRFRKKASISKSPQLHAVVGEGGLVDQFKSAVTTNKDPDQIEALAKAMKSRLSKWGPASVDRADSPAIANLYNLVAGFEEWAKQYKENAKEIDEAIHGSITAQEAHTAQHMEWRDQQVAALKDRQVQERANLTAVHDRRINTVASNMAERMARINEGRTLSVQRIYNDGDAAAARLKTQATNALYKQVRGEERKINDSAQTELRGVRETFSERIKVAKLEKRDALAKLAKKHHNERVEMGKTIRTAKIGFGDLSATLMDYGKTVDAYHQALADYTPDSYKDVFVSMYEKHLLAHEQSATLVAATEKHLKDKVGMAADRIDVIRSDPRILAEYMTAVFRGLYGQPDWTPEVASMAQRAMRDARDSAKESLKEAIGKGLVVQYIPSATSFDLDLGRSAFDPIIGKGIPKPDMEKMKLWDMTPNKHDFALGVTKSTIQTFQRQGVIDLVEHTLTPMAVKASDLNVFIGKHFRTEEGIHGGNLGNEMQTIAAKQMHMRRFDPNALFGFTRPAWGHGEDLYLPESVISAFEKINKDRGGLAQLGAKSTKLFRYSILGLSPRYTAHVLFGGTMMLALRSSPLVFTFLPAAWKGIRDGTIPGMGRALAEEGFEDTALRLRNEANGKWAGNEMLAENVEKRQGIARAAAKPVHWLKAAADINFRFTRYIRDMQYAVAYLDGAAKTERRAGKITLEDPETGEPIQMTPERAMKEGQHHAEQVFGNLDRMSPFERQIAQSVMPFYGWQKHILSYVMSYPFDHPWRALVLSQMAFNASQSVSLALPLRIQFLLNLGSPDAQGNVQPIDIRTLDPFRDVANYATWTGVFESLNPALSAPLTMAFGSQATYGEASLYPNVTYNQFYGIETAGSQGSLLTGIENWAPQTGALDTAIQAVAGVRSEWDTNRSAAIKSMLENVGIPFVTPPINLKQLAAKGQDARFEVAKSAAYNAFQSGDFSGLSGYKTVPYPLNTAYEVTPAQLEAIYKQAQQATPGVAPIESLLPPPTPFGY